MVVANRNTDSGRSRLVRSFARRRTIVLGALVAALCVLPDVAISSAQAASLTGWLGSGATFPNRALVLIPPAGASVNASTVHVTENGTAVRGLSVTPSSQAGRGDFGLIVVADQSSSMTGATLKTVMSATRNLVALRRAEQQFGVIGFDRQPRVLAPLSADSGGLQQALSATPATGRGANTPAAIQLALDKLSQARVALGAIVVISDGVGSGTGSLTPAAVAAVAAAAHIPIFVVGLQDKAASAASLGALRTANLGQFVQAPPSRLAGVLKAIDGVVTRGYVARWRSSVPSGHAVTVSANVDTAAGTVTATYQSPASSAPSAKPHAAATSPVTASHPAQLATTGRLSPLPSFSLASAPLAASTAAPPSPPQVAPASFWSSGAGKLATALFVGLLVAAAVWLLLYRPSRRAVRVRVGSFIHVDAETVEDPLAGPAVPNKSIVHRLENSDRWQAFALNVEIARSPHTPIYLVKRAIVLAMVLAALLVLLSGSTFVGFLPLIGWWFVLRALIERRANKQREKFRQSLPGYLQDLASAIRVGRSLVGALTVVAESADEPTKRELERAVTDEALGRPLDTSLEAVATRMEAPDLDQIAIIAALNRRSGSNVAEALDRVAEGARERQDLKREVKALTAQAKMSSWVLTALPGLLLVGLALLSPMYAHPLFHTTMGIIALFMGAGMCFAGWKVLSKITNVRI
jgi:tight adherence protein B